jgi:hypothetical protein
LPKNFPIIYLITKRNESNFTVEKPERHQRNQVIGIIFCNGTVRIMAMWCGIRKEPMAISVIFLDLVIRK